MHGLDCFVGDDVVIPKVGANYDDDPKTVTAVQYALVHTYGYDLGASGNNSDGVDGLYGSKTKAGVKKLQKTLGYDQTGIIDENVVRALKVTPGKLPPGVSATANAAVQAQAVDDAAMKVEHAVTPQQAAQAADDVQKVANAALPPLPPDVKQKVDNAVAQVKAAKTPADVQAASTALVSAAKEAHTEMKPSWVVSPAWSGGPAWWKTLAAGGGALVVGGLAVIGLRRMG